MIFLRDSSIDKMHEALVTCAIYALLIVIEMGIPYIGLEDKRKKAKRSMEGQDTTKTDDTHILYHILFMSLGYMAFLWVAIDQMQIIYSPLHCHRVPELDQIKCVYSKIDPFSFVASDVGYLILMIFCIGPLRLFFKIKEGKTSLEKIKDNYEEERGNDFISNAMRRQQGLKEDRGFLPTTTIPSVRRAAKTNDISEFN